MSIFLYVYHIKVINLLETMDCSNKWNLSALIVQKQAE
jgi:hypothetical protein